MRVKLFTIPVFGGITVYTYGTLIVVGFLVGAWWARRAASRRLSVHPERTFNVAFALLFLGLLGARFAYAISHYGEFSREPLKLLKIWEGGLLLHGGVVVALLWLAWWLPRQPDLPAFAFLDVLARGACLALAVGWLAPLLAGDDFGKPTKLPWGIPVVAFEDSTPVVKWASSAAGDAALARIHPTQVYESLLALALFFALAPVHRRGASGRAFALALMALAVGRALLDLLRADSGQAPTLPDRGFVIPGRFSWTQFLAIPIGLAGLAVWLIRRGRPPGAARAPAAGTTSPGAAHGS